MAHNTTHHNNQNFPYIIGFDASPVYVKTMDNQLVIDVQIKTSTGAATKLYLTRNPSYNHPSNNIPSFQNEYFSIVAYRDIDEKKPSTPSLENTFIDTQSESNNLIFHLAHPISATAPCTVQYMATDTSLGKTLDKLQSSMVLSSPMARYSIVAHLVKNFVDRSTFTEQQQPSSTEQQQSSSTEQQQSTSTEQQQSSSTEQQQPTSTEQQQSTSTEQQQSTSTEQQQSTSTEQETLTSPEQDSSASSTLVKTSSGSYRTFSR